MTVEGMNAGVPTNYAPAFIHYVENIYVGYKFYETADKEGVIDYDSVVQYPFGYGLSYTSFRQTMSEITVDGENVSFDEREGCYVLEKGDYRIAVKADSHRELDSEVYTQPSAAKYDASNPRPSDDAAAVNRLRDARGEVEYLSRKDGHGFMNADEALANGVDAMLSTFAGGPNQVSDKSAASNVKYMREATHNILYTTVNSWAYDEEHSQGGLEAWKKILITADAVAGLALCLGAFGIYKKYKKTK